MADPNLDDGDWGFLPEDQLEMGRKETQSLRKGKQKKRLLKEENDSMEAVSQVDHENDAVRRLEIENAVIRADVEASKLRASELVKTRMEAEKSEKKYLKKISECDKSNIQLREVKQKILQLTEQLLLVKETQREAEIKCKLELKAKEMIMTELQEEQGSNEAYEIVSESCRDDLQRLEKELSELKEEICNMKCIVCIHNEASVVFLPCAHQVLCASCGEDYALLRNVTCPHCFVQIEETISL